MDEAGVGHARPGSLQVCQTKGTANQNGDSFGPDGVAEVEMDVGGELMFQEDNAVDVLWGRSRETVNVYTL